MTHSLILTTAMVSTLTACGSTKLVPPDEVIDIGSDISTYAGCSDLYLYAANADETVAAFASLTGAIANAGTVDQQELTFDLADDTIALEVTLETGAHLLATACTDLFNLDPVIDATWTPTEGTATLTIYPNAATDTGPTADLAVVGAVFTDGTDLTAPVNLTWTNISVGWMPG